MGKSSINADKSWRFLAGNIILHSLIMFDYHLNPWVNHLRLVVLTILKNSSQWEGLSHILLKEIKNV